MRHRARGKKVCLSSGERHPLRPLMPAGPAVTEPRSIPLYTGKRRSVCARTDAHKHTRGLLYNRSHMSKALGVKNIRLEMKLWVKWCVSVRVPSPDFTPRRLILEKDADR